MRIVISSGHGLYVRGASGYIDEVDEARRVVDQVATNLRLFNAAVTTFHDNTSHTQEENLHTIVDFHNSQTRDLDVSVHFNAYVETFSPMGTEVLYVTQENLAGELSLAISDAGRLPNRGPKYRNDLFFLNQTEMPAVLIETCFVDSQSDANQYRAHFIDICRVIAQTIMDRQTQPPERPERPERPPPENVAFRVKGTCSWFGGPDDTGVRPEEGLAFIYDFDTHKHLFLPSQPNGTTGLARRLDPDIFYVACRWDYNRTPKEVLADHSCKAVVRANGKAFLAYPADWGPNESTGRVADLSPGLMEALGLDTDEEVEIIYPA